ncbi:MAG: hypothetical protein ABWX57_05685 [Aeromicrobium sp.]
MKRAALLLLGAYVCVLGAFVHRHVWFAGGTTWPWGLVLVIGVTFLVARAAEQTQRVGAAWFALGWGAVLMGLQYSPGGSYLVASDRVGWTFTAGCLGAIVVTVLRPPRLGA